MSVIKNINSVNVCTLGDKGVDLICAALDSLTKKDGSVGKRWGNFFI